MKYIGPYVFINRPERYSNRVKFNSVCQILDKRAKGIEVLETKIPLNDIILVNNLILFFPVLFKTAQQSKCIKANF